MDMRITGLKPPFNISARSDVEQLRTPALPKPKVESPTKQFGDEILGDLPKLIQDYPYGVYFSHLAEYYGESVSRITRAINYLAEQDKVTLLQAANKAYYVLPRVVGQEIKPTLPGLTPNQRRLVLYIYRIAQKSTIRQVQTNCSQLSRQLNTSYGGMRAAVKRCIDLGYLILHSDDSLQNMILSVNPSVITGDAEDVPPSKNDPEDSLERPNEPNI